jgi:hypothetical protein
MFFQELRASQLDFTPSGSNVEAQLTKVVSVALVANGQGNMSVPKSTNPAPDALASFVIAPGTRATCRAWRGYLVLVAGRHRWGRGFRVVVFARLDRLELKSFGFGPVVASGCGAGVGQDRVDRFLGNWGFGRFSGHGEG